MNLNTRQKKAVFATENKILVASGAGSGKALTNSTILPTPNGWKQVKDIKVGDNLYDKDGNKTVVLGVYPQGKKDVYRITFGDRRQIDCSIDHLWVVHNINKDIDYFETKSLKEILEEGLKTEDNRKQFYIPYSKPIEKNTKIYNGAAPYEAGFVLGKHLNSFYQNIAIPIEYSEGDLKQRLSFIQGLFDAAADIVPKNKYLISLSYSSKDFLKDVKNILATLGYVCLIKEENKNYKLIVNISNQEKQFLFKNNTEKIKLAIKAKKFYDNRMYDRTSISSVEKLNIQEEMTCFLVDNPSHTFLCGEYIVTHNTRVLTERIKFLLETAPKNEKIVAITFTNMAAEEIKKRLPEYNNVFIGTIHSYANSICLANGLDLSEYINRQQFDIILKKVLTIKQECYEKIDHLLIDEFQDTSPLEMAFIERIPKKNFFVLGDDRQCIYTFRGTTDAYFVELSNDPTCKKYYLSENYRCPPNVITYAESFLSSSHPVGVKSIPIKSRPGYIKECSFYDALIDLKADENWIDWFVLCRTNSDLAAVLEILEREEIPCISFKKGDLNLEEMENLIKSNKVKVLTIHAAKGLQNKNVIVIGAKTFNEEERKICYVAATRTESDLYWCPSLMNRKRHKDRSRADVGRVFEKTNLKNLTF